MGHRRRNGNRGSRGGNKKQERGNRGQGGGQSKLKTFIKEIKASVEKTKGFWTQLPYGMCQDNTLVSANAQTGSTRTSKRISSNNNSKDEKVRNVVFIIQLTPLNYICKR